MNCGVCVCVLLAALSVTFAARTRSSPAQEENNALPSQMDSSMNAGHDANPRANLNELLARLISRKGSVRRNSMANSKASALSTNHRIKDRDYLGWMDFGRRSAEEYDYSS
ncbi:cholecystokinin [Silurus meridionalis]|uniref:cholecystokinin n=1 Tax=Silurus meridionalis TaxID=175797 RepID=UPI001EEA71D6|nr:cholecystokinin [Silurus meridionalis]XP_046721389.1 cholecystokinin [Silurus meridionalis]KAI5097740.1 cholecystokinin [Silurus meridionalis]